MKKTEQQKTIELLAGLDMWGQLNQAQEECAELIAAINKYRRVKTEQSYIAMLEEIADVIIMMRQCAVMFDSELIESFINMKLERASERVKNGKL